MSPINNNNIENTAATGVTDPVATPNITTVKTNDLIQGLVNNTAQPSQDDEVQVLDEPPQKAKNPIL